MTSEDDMKQMRLARQRLEMLEAVIAAQDRHSEVSAVIAAADDKNAAIDAIGALLGIGTLAARAVSDLPWRRLAGDSRRQALEDRDEIVAELRRMEAGSCTSVILSSLSSRLVCQRSARSGA